MDWVGIMLNSICLAFITFLIFIYFSRKSIKNIDNKCYRYTLISCLMVDFSELVFLICSYFFIDNLFLLAFLKKVNYLMIVCFFYSIFYYVLSISLENNQKFQNLLKQISSKIKSINIIVLSIIAFFQFILPVEFYYRDNGYLYYVGGLACNPYSAFVVIIFLAILIPTIKKNWKSINKKRLSTFIFLTIAEVITLIINFFLPSLCLASFSLTISCYWMYFTIENPDIKIIAQLEYAKNQAEKSNKAKSDFLSSMSHEIRTPLNAIVGLSQMMKETNEIESIHKDLDDVLVASQRLLEIINGILDVNKLEAGEMKLESIVYNPRTIFDDLERIFKINIGTKSIKLRMHYPENLPLELYGDKEKVKQILTNLLSNAVKYTEEGFIDFIVVCNNIKDNCQLSISVKDTGKGIKENQLPNLFGKFYRSEENMDSDISGTGLGLSITKALVELLDGDINVESIYGVGSTFTFRFNQKIISFPVSNVNYDDNNDLVSDNRDNSVEIL